MRVYADGPDFNINHITFSALPPGTPSGLEAVPIAADQVDLSWSTSAGAQFYTVKRTVTSGGPYGIIASNVESNSFSDTNGLHAGTRYYYVISAQNSGGTTSTDSEESSVIPSAEILAHEYVLDEMFISNGILKLTVSNSVPGHTYVLQGKIHLTDPVWLEAPPVPGTGTNILYSYTLEGYPDTFFFKLDVSRQ